MDGKVIYRLDDDISFRKCSLHNETNRTSRVIYKIVGSDR